MRSHPFLKEAGIEKAPASYSGGVHVALYPFSAMMMLRGKPRGSLPENGRRLALSGGTETLR